MMYKCLKCENEFDIAQDAICPKCGATDYDVEPLRKWKMAHPVAGDEA